MKRTSNKWLGGVLGGLSNYFNIDTTVLRIGFLVAFLLTAGSLFLFLIIFYISLWALVPYED